MDSKKIANTALLTKNVWVSGGFEQGIWIFTAPSNRRQSLKYGPEANALSQPHSIKPAHLESRFSGDCYWLLCQATDWLTGAAARCCSRNRLGFPSKGYCLELFINQPELFINWPELFINQPELCINWPELFINWLELFLNWPELLINQPELLVNWPELCRKWATRWSRLFLNLPGLMTWLDVFLILPAVLPKFNMCTSLAWSGFANLSFAASQWPEHLIEPMPNYLGHDLIIWLRHSAIIVFTWHRVPASLWDLNQTLFWPWQIVHAAFYMYQLLRTYRRAITDAGRMQFK